MNNTLIIGLIVAGVALLFCIIATAIPFWWKSDFYSIGLFRTCINHPIVGNACVDFEDTTDWIKATRAMMILSILALLLSLTLAVLFGFVMKDKQILALGAAAMSIAAAGLALLGVIIFGAKIPLDLYDIAFGKGSLHASFGLAILTFPIASVAGLIFIFSKTRNV